VQNQSGCHIHHGFGRHKDVGTAGPSDPGAPPVEFWLFSIQSTRTKITIVLTHPLGGEEPPPLQDGQTRLLKFRLEDTRARERGTRLFHLEPPQTALTGTSLERERNKETIAANY